MDLTKDMIGKIIPGYQHSEDILQKDITVESATMLDNFAGIVVNGRLMMSLGQAMKLVNGELKPGDFKA